MNKDFIISRQTNRQRDPRVDILKGILIILVVLGHSVDKKYARFIFQFHMPLFFILSGYLYHGRSSSEHRKWLKSKIQRFMIPYFAWYVLVTLIHLNHFSWTQLLNIHSEASGRFAFIGVVNRSDIDAALDAALDAMPDG